jgi:phage antirepressor YoqD-like protein
VKEPFRVTNNYYYLLHKGGNMSGVKNLLIGEPRLRIETVNFDGAELISIKDLNNDTGYGAIKYICQGLGLSERKSRQEVEKLKSDPVLSKGIRLFGLPTNGGIQEAICLEWNFIPIWLAKINLKIIKDETLKTKLIEYQIKAKDILASAFINKNENVLAQLPGSLEEMYMVAANLLKENREANEKLEKVEKEKDIINLSKKKLERDLEKSESENVILHQLMEKYKDKLFSIRELSDEFNIPGLGRDKLFEILRQEKILFRSGGNNFPMQVFKDRGYFVSTQVPVQRGETTMLVPKPLATIKGFYYVARKLERLGLMNKEKVGDLKSRYLGQENKNLTLNFENV